MARTDPARALLPAAISVLRYDGRRRLVEVRQTGYEGE